MNPVPEDQFCNTHSTSEDKSHREQPSTPRTLNLLLRILTAAVGLPVLFAVVWLGEPLVSIAIAIVAVTAALEFYFLIGKRWISPATLAGLFFTAVFLIGAIFFDSVVLPVLAAASVALCLGILYLKQRQQLSFVGPVMWGGLGAFLIAWPLAHFVLLRDLSQGRDWVFYILVTVFAADAGAYFIGKAVGQRKLAPRISPNKTMEGAGGGIAAAVILGTLAHFVMDLPGALAPIAALSAIVALVSMAGRPCGVLPQTPSRRQGVRQAPPGSRRPPGPPR